MAPDALAQLGWPTLLVTGAAAFILVAYGVRTALGGRRRDPRIARAGGSFLVGRWFVEAFYWSFQLPGRAFAAMGVSPDALTWTSLAITALAAPSAALGHFSTAGALVVLGSVFDSFDGLVARARGLSSDRGEMLDAVVDRYADMAPLLGLVVFYRSATWQMALPLAALAGSLLLSYVRAKAEALDLDLPNGLMRRHERIAYVAIALVIGPVLTPWLGAPLGAVHPATLAVIAFVAVASNVAALRLLAAARRELDRQGRGPKRAGGAVKGALP